MSRRAATLTQADVARTIRAARQSGAEAVEVRPDGSILVLIKAPPLVPSDDPFDVWKREREQAKTARHR